MKKEACFAAMFVFLGLEIGVMSGEQVGGGKNESGITGAASQGIQAGRAAETTTAGKSATGLTNNAERSDEEEVEEILRIRKQQLAEDKELMKKMVLAEKDQLIKDLKSADPRKRAHAAGSITEYKFKEAIPQLGVLAVSDPDKKVRRLALSSLAAMEDPAVIPYMLKVVENNKNPKDRMDVGISYGAALTLLDFRRKEGLAVLVQMLDSTDEGIQVETYCRLKEITNKDFGDFDQFQNDPDGNLRVVIRDHEKMKEIFAKWKRWWKEEGDKFTFPMK